MIADREDGAARLRGRDREVGGGAFEAKTDGGAAAAGVPIIHKPLHPARLRALLNHLAAETRAAA